MEPKNVKEMTESELLDEITTVRPAPKKYYCNKKMAKHHVKNYLEHLKKLYT